jgi:hypothetical protein
MAKVISSQSTSLQQGFLPNLKVLEYTGKLHLRPGNYDDLLSLLPANNAVHGPLNLVKINLTLPHIPKNVISCLSSFVERGITVNIMFKSQDIFQFSIGYFRRSEADNLDLTHLCRRVSN